MLAILVLAAELPSTVSTLAARILGTSKSSSNTEMSIRTQVL